MATAQAEDQLEVGVTYWPAAVGPFMWHELHVDTVRHDLALIAARGVETARVLLPWDAFMPSDRAPNPRRMRDVESLLDAARQHGLRMVLTLFAQSVGDCVMLPTYAIDRRAPRRGVRCVTDGRPVAGGPRDLYTDPLMLETQVRWLDAMLVAFAGHPAVACWELGHDPATTIRPARIADLSGWAALLGERIHERGELCRLTLGQGDVVRGRAVRLASLTGHVDRVGVLVHPQVLPLPGDALEPGRAVFVVELALALAGAALPVSVELGIASGDPAAVGEPEDAVADRVTAPAEMAARSCDEMLQRVIERGVVGVHAAAWSDWGERLREAPPSDRRPWLSHRGIVDSAGVSKPIGRAWEGLVTPQRSVVGRSPYLSAIDVESYYENLPESLLDLHSSWQGDQGDRPAILD